MGDKTNVMYKTSNTLSRVIFTFPLFQVHLHTLPNPKTTKKQIN